MRNRLLLISLIAAAPVAAQLPSASASALGAGDAYTALARGFNAVAWNPAGLAMTGNPGFSITLVPVRAVGSFGPISLKDLKDYEGIVVPADVKEAWLQKVEAEGAQSAQFQAGVTELALSIGSFAVHVGSQATVVADMGPGAMELLFFGNAGRTGEPRPITGEGSAAVGLASTTAGVSFGRTISQSPASKLAMGITGKYTMGHALFVAVDAGTSLTASPIGGQVLFPTVLPITDEDERSINNGNGIGFDIGLGLERGPWTFGFAVQNVFHTFKWDASNFEFRKNYWDIENDTSDMETYPLESWPELAKVVEDLRFKPVIAVGAAWKPVGRVTLSGDLRMRTDEDGLEGGPKRFLGLGAEFRVLPFLPLRIGAASTSDGTILTGGAGLAIGFFNLAGAVGVSQGDGGSDPIAALTLSFGAR